MNQKQRLVKDGQVRIADTPARAVALEYEGYRPENESDSTAKGTVKPLPPK